MKMSPRLCQLSATLARLAVLAGLALVFTSCGSSSTTPVATSPIDMATPTPIPTTPPLSLPAADDTLPALAPLPASVVTSAPTTETRGALDEAVAADDSASSTEDGSTASDIGAPDSTVTNTTVEPTPSTEQDVVPAPTASRASSDSAPADDGTGLLAITSAASWSDCVVLAAQTTGTTTLLDPIAAAVATDMSSVQLNSLASASVSCDMVTSGLLDTAVGDYLPTATTCLNAWLESSGGGSVFVGLASIGWGQPTPAWAQGHLIDALNGCFTGASFAADVMSVVSADTSLNGAFDAACLATSFDSSGTLRTYAQALASDPATANLYVSLSDSWVLNCANAGQMVAAAALADGVSLSGSTISCIDSELKSTGAITQLLAGTADTDAVGIATIACLTDGEATALLG